MEVVALTVTIVTVLTIFAIEWVKHRRIERRKIRKSSEDNE